MRGLTATGSRSQSGSSWPHPAATASAVFCHALISVSIRPGWLTTNAPRAVSMMSCAQVLWSWTLSSLIQGNGRARRSSSVPRSSSDTAIRTFYGLW